MLAYCLKGKRTCKECMSSQISSANIFHNSYYIDVETKVTFTLLFFLLLLFFKELAA
jgi:hypothetical protein